MADQTSHFRYTYGGRTGYIVAPWIPDVGHEMVTIRHSAAAPPWADRDTHLHSDSEEYYFLFQGELEFLAGGVVFTLRPYEVLMVQPNVPHAVVGGTGPIEHFVLRVPAQEDRQTVATTPAELSPAAGEAGRMLQADWGCRVPLTEARYQNCWLFGVGQARFRSERMCLAYVYFPVAESIGTDRHRHRPHLHRESWEYYTVLRGTRVLRIEEELVEINAGEVLAVPPQVKHVLHGTATPFEGVTFRVPLVNDKVEF